MLRLVPPALKRMKAPEHCGFVQVVVVPQPSLCGMSLLAGLVASGLEPTRWLDPELVCGARCGAASRPVAGS